MGPVWTINQSPVKLLEANTMMDRYINLAPDSAPEILLKNTASERPPLLADRSPECHGAMTCRLIHDDAHHAPPQLLLSVPGSRPANQNMHERSPHLCLDYRHTLPVPA